MADKQFDLKGFLNDPKVQANKPAAIQYLKTKGVLDEQGNVTEQYKTPSQEIVKQPSLNDIVQNVGNKAGELGAGIIKGVGRSVFNVAQEASKTFSPLGITGLTKSPEMKMPDVLEYKSPTEKIGGGIETAAEILAPIPGEKAKVGESLINQAMSLYQKALKPSTALSTIEREKILKTGLDEAITLTKSGIDKTASKIDDLETQLGQSIKEAAGKGGKLMTDTLKPFVDEAKKFLGETVDVKGSKNAVKEIDKIYTDFVKKYGKSIDLETAQKLKTNTYQVIKKYYEKMSSPAIEASKQMARGIKEGIVKEAPQVEGINERLGKLYNFETALEKASGRIGNLNVLSLGSKFFLGEGSKAGIASSVVNELFGPAGKSISAVAMNKIGNFLKKGTPEELKAFYDALGAAGKISTISNIKENIK